MGERADFDRTDRPATAQPPPIPTGGASVHVAAADDATRYGYVSIAGMLRDRAEFGLRKYGTPLTVWNGRDPVCDAAEEAADLVAYLRQAMDEGRPVGHLYWPVLAIAEHLARAQGQAASTPRKRPDAIADTPAPG